MYARRFLDIKKAQKKAQEAKEKRKKLFDAWFAEGCKRKYLPPEVVSYAEKKC